MANRSMSISCLCDGKAVMTEILRLFSGLVGAIFGGVVELDGYIWKQLNDLGVIGRTERRK